MKLCLLRSLLRQDCRDEIRHYRREAGTRVAVKLADALEKALDELTRQPGIGSPGLGQELDVAGMRKWRIDGFPLTFWYFERETYKDVARLVGERQDGMCIDMGEEQSAVCAHKSTKQLFPQLGLDIQPYQIELLRVFDRLLRGARS